MKKWCLCFERLLLDDLPIDPWDAPMDAVEAGVYPHSREEGSGQTAGCAQKEDQI